MTEVYYIPDLNSNIISLGQATESGCDVRLHGEYLTMHDRDGKLLVKALRARNRLYKVRMGLKEDLCLYSSSMGDCNMWHSRLGHVNLETIKHMIQRDLVKGIPQVKFEKEIRQAFPKSTSYRATKILDLIHGDLCSPISPKTAAGNRYIFVIVDDHSRYMW